MKKINEIIDMNKINDFMNVYMIYYKKLYNKKTNYKMFDDLDSNKDTNSCMEILYDEIERYKKSSKEINENIKNYNECERIYIIYYDEEKKGYCDNLVTAIKYISEKEWKEKNWSIMQIKNNI